MAEKCKYGEHEIAYDTVNIKDGDLLIIRFPDDADSGSLRRIIEAARKLRDTFREKGKESCGVITCGSSYKFETADEEFMNSEGWYRKEATN